MIKSYRGLLANEGQNRIRLRTKDGKTGYRIAKFQVIPENPYAAADKELVFKVYKTQQGTPDGVIDFSDQTLIAAATYSDSDGSAAPVTQYSESVIFDNEVINQDIYVTYVDKHGSQSGNYYIELETVELSDTQAAQTTLKALRTLASR